MAQQSQIRTIRVIADVKGNQALKQLADQFGGLNRSVSKALSSFGGFRNLIAAGIFGFGIRELVGISDELQNLSNRINILSGSAEKGQQVFIGLARVADDTNTSIDGVATIYSRLAASTKDAGVSSRTLLDVTKTLQNTFRLSGATISEATSATIQLSQGLASGQLRGQELRSVLEANVEIGDILTRSLGKTRGELFKFAEQGKITSAVVLRAIIDNIDRVDEKAGKLGQTFEQTLIKALNDLKIAILNVNREFDLSGKFARAVDGFTEKIGLLGIAISILALTRVPALITSLVALGATIRALATGATLLSFTNVYTAALTLLAIAVVTVFNNLDDLRSSIVRLNTAFEEGVEKAGKFFKVFSVLPFLKEIPIAISAITTALNQLSKISEKDPLQNVVDARRADDLLLSEPGARVRRLEEDLKKIDSLAKKGEEKALKRADLLKKINQDLAAGRIDVQQYYEALFDIDRLVAKSEFKNGALTLQDYNKALNEIDLRVIKQQFTDGAISLEEFNSAVERNGLAKLRLELDAGTISAQEYRKKVLELSSEFSASGSFRVGTEDFLASIEKVGVGVAGTITRAFDSLGEAFFNFVKTGKFNFTEFAQSVLDDLTKIIIRSQVIAPLARGLLDFAGASIGDAGGFGSSPVQVGGGNFATFANGGVFNGGLKKFARGGVVGNPTLFNYGSNKTGMMGEAGPEAILPLQRGVGGNLGVSATVTPVTVNIINNSGSEVDQRETTGPNGERVLDILIQSRVKEGISSGSFDKVLAQSFALRRKGG